MKNKKFPPLLLIGLIVTLISRIISNLKPKNPEVATIIEKQTAPEQTEYSLKSDYLWEEAPECSAEYTIKYAESVFYQNEEHTNRIKPVVKPEGPGFFTAYPGGLHIDHNTGEIDVNASDTGICYTIEFTPCGEKCVAKTEVVISGIWYKSRIFSLTTSPPEEYIAQPFYNGEPGKQPPRGKFGISPNKCPEPTGLNGLIIDSKTGAINLKETIMSGALGFRKTKNNLCADFPANGTSKTFKIYYRLNDPSEGALNEITIRLHFYNTKEDIPYELRRRIEQQNNSFYRVKRAAVNFLPLLLGLPLTVLPDAPWQVLAALLAALSSLLFLNALSSDDPCRPPEHCATAS